MKSHRILFLLCCLTNVAFAHLEPTYYLSGSIGERKVGVQIDHFSQAVYLKYFYQDTKKNIIFKGQADSTTFHFQSPQDDSDQPEHIVLKHLPNEEWEGFMVAGGDTLQIKLGKIVMEDVGHAYANEELKSLLNPYGYLRTSDLRFEQVRKSNMGKYKVKWFEESVTGIVSFQVYRKWKKQQTVPMNEVLRNQHIKQIEYYFECGTHGFDGKYAVNWKLKYLDEAYLSLSVTTNAACFSERVDSTTRHTTYDMEQAEAMNLEQFIYVGEGEVPTSNPTEWFNYRRNVFAPFVVNLLEPLYPDQFSSNQDCSYDDKKAWQNPTWYLTDIGLYLGAQFPGIDKSCNNPDWSIIPYDLLADYRVRN